MIQKKKYHYKKIKNKKSPTNKNNIYLKTKNSSYLNSSQLNHNYNISNPKKISIVNSTHLNHNYKYSNPKKFYKTNTSHHNINNKYQNLKKLPHSNFLPPKKLKNNNNKLNINNNSNNQKSIIHNNIPLKQRIKIKTIKITNPYLKLQSNLLKKITFPFILNYNNPNSLIKIIQLSRNKNKTSIKLSLIIKRNFKINLFIHRILIPKTHKF